MSDTHSSKGEVEDVDKMLETKKDEDNNKKVEEEQEEEICFTVQNIPICSHMSKMRLFPLLYIISLCRLLPPSPLPVVKAQEFPPQNPLSGTLS
jgi:hypothetical protein